MVIPASWKQSELGEVLLSIVGGGTPSKSNPSFYEGDIPWMSVKDMNKNILNDTVDHISEEAVENSSTNVIPSGTPIIATRMSLGKIVVANFDSAINQDLKALFPATGVNRDFLIGWYRSIAKKIEALGTGTTVKGIRLEVLNSLEFPLPPLAEQKVIADKLDTLLAQVETSKARLERIPQILKTFRQSVLAAAVSGKLTEEWRGYNGASNVNLEQIAEQHKAYFIETRRKYNEPAEFKANSLTPKIPGNWRWFRAEQLCDLITKGTTPKKEHMTSSGDIPYIKVYNLTFDGTLDFSIEPTFIPKLVHDTELKRSKVFPGDVLMNIVGPPLGKVSIVPDSHEEWNINQAISIFRPVSGVTNEYLSICLRDEFLLELTKSKAKATAGQFNLTLEICRDYSIPVPPQEEQTEIVRRVEALFAFADRIEQNANAALERVNNLTQSILAKAFRGELTADWRAANPDLISGENSAEALLKKIKAERAALRKRSEKKTATRKKA